MFAEACEEFAGAVDDVPLRAVDLDAGLRHGAAVRRLANSCGEFDGLLDAFQS